MHSQAFGYKVGNILFKSRLCLRLLDDGELLHLCVKLRLQGFDLCAHSEAGAIELFRFALVLLDEQLEPCLILRHVR